VNEYTEQGLFAEVRSRTIAIMGRMDEGREGREGMVVKQERSKRFIAA
jgi:hypothetical protein